MATRKKRPLAPVSISVDAFLANEETPFVPGGMYLMVLPHGYHVGILACTDQVGSSVCGSIQFLNRMPLTVRPGDQALKKLRYLGGGVSLDDVQLLAEGLRED